MFPSGIRRVWIWVKIQGHIEYVPSVCHVSAVHSAPSPSSVANTMMRGWLSKPVSCRRQCLGWSSPVVVHASAMVSSVRESGSLGRTPSDIEGAACRSQAYPPWHGHLQWHLGDAMQPPGWSGINVFCQSFHFATWLGSLSPNWICCMVAFYIDWIFIGGTRSLQPPMQWWKQTQRIQSFFAIFCTYRHSMSLALLNFMMSMPNWNFFDWLVHGYCNVALLVESFLPDTCALGGHYFVD